MRIGLIRHFRVDLYRASFMTSKEYDEYSYNYDRREVIPNEVVIDEEWDKCYCSSLSRAITTAKTVYHGEIIITDKLVEIPSAAGVKTNLRLPYYFWAILNRTSWGRNHVAHPEGRTNTLKRVNEILDVILSEKVEDVLIVSHAGTLYEIEKILTRKGFRGERFIKPKNGRLYEFRR
ncbi:MAG: Phosphoglycerate mutase [Clostridiales bacterium]|jgi:hypothetical protein|nr:Phosphoglycerate mutase [Clostridiales bacterium]